MRAGYPNEHVLAAVARLVEIGLVDDERYAQALIESRIDLGNEAIARSSRNYNGKVSMGNSLSGSWWSVRRGR